jgi:hypothetical protein
MLSVSWWQIKVDIICEQHQLQQLSLASKEIVAKSLQSCFPECSNPFAYVRTCVIITVATSFFHSAQKSLVEHRREGTPVSEIKVGHSKS